MTPARGTTARVRALVALVMLAVAAPTVGQPMLPDEFQQGRLAYEAGDFATARAYWEPLGESGDARAQFAMGTLYYEGAGVERDLAASTAWFRRAAEQGLPAAQYNVGNAYRYGYGVPQDDREAVTWWTRAAEKGLVSAAYNLGTQYRYGRGVELDLERARYWYEQAAAGGHVEARYYLDELASAASRPDSDALDGATRAAPVAAAPAPAATAEPRVEAARGEQDTADVHGQAWLLQQDPNHYTIQLAALAVESRLEEFVRRHGLRGPLARFQFDRGGRRFHVLTRGVYADRGSARAAIANLSEPLRASAPWPRRLGEIQALIRAQDEG